MNDAVEAAKSPEVFDLNKFLSDSAYPVQDVTVHNDAYSVNEKLKVMERIAELQDEIKQAELAAKKTQRTLGETANAATDPAMSEELAKLHHQLDEWDAVIAKSAITLHLQGMPPEIVEQISAKHFPEVDKDYSNTPEEQARDYELIARTVIRITAADGSTSTAPLTGDDIKALRSKLLTGEYDKLVKAVSRVTLNGALFEIAADASFLGRRSDVAG